MTATETVVRVGLVVLAAVLALTVAVVVLRVVPEPSDDEPGAREKPSYAGLVRPRFLTGVVLLAGLTAGIAVWRLDPALWPAWLVLSTLGAVLAAVDAATTWLPNGLMYPFWLAVGVAVLVSTAVGAAWPTLLRAVVGAVAWGLLFWLVWAFSRGQLGFGDVRLAFGLGAAAGAAGWMTIYTCLLAGTVLGAVWGVVHRLRRGPRAGPFPYGLALLLGCGLGLALTPSAG